MQLSPIRCLSLLAILAYTCVALDPVSLVYEFDKGTSVENLAVRPCGSILLSTDTAPNLYLIDPSKNSTKPELLHNFSEGLGLVGITETTPDNFFVVVSNLSLTTLTAPAGSNRIFRVFFPPANKPVEISLVATVTGAGLLNGLATLNSKTILAADSNLGEVWAIDTVTGESRVTISDPLMATSPTFPLPIGINGVKVRNSTLFFTNTAQALFAKVPLRADGTALTDATLISNAPKGTFYDDFALDGHGHAFLTTGNGNSISRVNLSDGQQEIIAGDLNSTQIAGPTSVAFGRRWNDRRSIYVSTSGAAPFPVNGDEVVGGQLVKVNVGGA